MAGVGVRDTAAVGLAPCGVDVRVVAMVAVGVHVGGRVSVDVGVNDGAMVGGSGVGVHIGGSVACTVVGPAVGVYSMAMADGVGLDSRSGRK